MKRKNQIVVEFLAGLEGFSPLESIYGAICAYHIPSGKTLYGTGIKKETEENEVLIWLDSGDGYQAVKYESVLGYYMAEHLRILEAKKTDDFKMLEDALKVKLARYELLL